MRFVLRPQAHVGWMLGAGVLGFAAGAVLFHERISSERGPAFAQVEGNRLDERSLTPGEQIKIYEARLSLYRAQEAIAHQRFLATRGRELGGTLAGEGRIQQLREELRKGRESGAVGMLEPPPMPPLVALGAGGNVVFGPESAPVTIEVFEDFQCPACARLVETFRGVAKRLEGKIRLVHRDFPLSFHEQALPSAIVARCAARQGRFPQTYDYLFVRSQALSEQVYSEIGKSVVPDSTAFALCRQEVGVRAAVLEELNKGLELSISGTPTFFVNGRMHSGLLGEAELVDLVLAELSRKS